MFPLLIAFLLAPSGCGVNRAWLQRDIRKGTLVHCRALPWQKKCVAAGCSNTPSGGVSLLKLPSDGVLRRIWEKQVQQTSSSVESYQELSFLCSDHFTEDLFRGGVGCHGGRDGGKEGCNPTTCCKVVAGSW